MKKQKQVIIWAIIILVILAGAAVFFAWVGDKKFKSPVFTVESGVIVDFHYNTNNQINATFFITVHTENRDKKYNYYYDSLMVDVYYNNTNLAYDNIGPMTLRHGSETTFVAVPVANNVSITNVVEAGDLRGELNAGKELIRLNVRVLANVKIAVKGWHSWRYTLSSICYPVVFDWRTGKTSAKTNCVTIIFS